ncbi:MAG: YARHG domain-containing protein, partial [Sphingomonadaceae bacterium]
VYARRGYMFKSELLSEYFAATDWYEVDPEFSNSKLTRADWRNIKLIKSTEVAHGGPMTDWEQMHEEGWFSGA